jgi:hypothetical protein
MKRFTMRNVILGTVFMVLLLLPITSALEAIPSWSPSCFNSTHIYLVNELNVTNSTGTEEYTFESIRLCPYGCDSERSVCWKWPGNAIPGEYYFLFVVFGLILLGVGLFRLGVKPEDMQPFDLVLSLLAAGLFGILALQGNNVIDMSTGEAVQVIMLVWYSFGFAGISLGVFVFNVFKFLGREVKDV